MIFISGIFLFPIFSDHGVFLTGGWLISEGHLPYVDFFDNKPPGIYCWNALKTSIFTHRLGWLLIDFSYYFTIILTVWSLLSKEVKKHLPLILAAFAAYTFFPSVFQYGGYTEIFGVGLILISILSYHKEHVLLAGLFAGLSVWFKEPFILFIFYPFCIPKNLHNRLQYIYGILFSGIGGIFLLFLWGVLPAYVNIVKGNLLYVYQPFLWDSMIPNNTSDIIKYGFRLLPLLLALFLLNKRQISRLSGFLTICGILAVIVGKRFYGHYFLFLSPAWLFLLIDLSKLSTIEKNVKYLLTSLIGFSLLIQLGVIQYQFPKLNNQINLCRELKMIIQDNETILTDMGNSFIYPLTKIKPALLADFVTIKDLYKMKSGKIDSVKFKRTERNFINKAPKYLYKPQQIFWFDNEWLHKYSKMKINGLYRRKDIRF